MKKVAIPKILFEKLFGRRNLDRKNESNKKWTQVLSIHFSTKNVFRQKCFGFFFDEKTFDQKMLVTYSDPKFPQDSKNRT